MNRLVPLPSLHAGPESRTTWPRTLLPIYKILRLKKTQIITRTHATLTFVKDIRSVCVTAIFSFMTRLDVKSSCVSSRIAPRQSLLRGAPHKASASRRAIHYLLHLLIRTIFMSFTILNYNSPSMCGITSVCSMRISLALTAQLVALLFSLLKHGMSHQMPLKCCHLAALRA